mgnify:CR=1 FL=1
MSVTVSADDIKRVKGLGFLQQKGTDTFNARTLTRNGKITAEEARKVADAAEKYGISRATAQKYATDYRRANGLPVKSHRSRKIESPMITLKNNASSFDLEDYQSMSKEELIQQLILSKANELRAKKGYEVKGDGRNKEFISLNNKNSKL